MNKPLEIASAALLTVAAVTSGGVGYLYAAFPHATAPASTKVVASAESIERGRYLAEHVAVCVDCHSERDWTRFAGPVVPGTEGRGGQRFGHEVGVPGNVYASNITPAAMGRHSDGELIRAMTDGVTKDGRPLFPLMPYQGLAQACERDREAIVTWVRGLRPIDHTVPKSELDFPVNLIVRTIPAHAQAPACPDRSDEVAYGKYLATLAACTDCHTPREKGAPVPGKGFAGGAEFGLPTGGTVRSANITPDATTGIGAWSKATFIARFKAFAGKKQHEVAPGDFQTVMPWTLFAGMSEADLGAMYAYLRTVPPVRNEVNRFSPPAK